MALPKLKNKKELIFFIFIDSLTFKIEIAFFTSPDWRAISEFAMRTFTSSAVPENYDIAYVIIFLASFDLLFY